MKCISLDLLNFQFISFSLLNFQFRSCFSSFFFRKNKKICDWIINTYNHITFGKFKCFNYIIEPTLMIAPCSSIWTYHIRSMTWGWKTKCEIFWFNNILMANSNCYPIWWSVYFFYSKSKGLLFLSFWFNRGIQYSKFIAYKYK